VCGDVEARIVEKSAAAATIAHNNNEILYTVPDTFIKPASPWVAFFLRLLPAHAE
jgi:hypothetical protein